MYLARKDVLPCIRNIVDAQKYVVEVVTQVRLSDNSWNGGTKYNYRGINLETGAIQYPESDEYGNPFSNPAVPTVEMQQGFAIVKYGTFHGKNGTPTIFLHPENATKLLPGEVDLSREEEIVLVFTRSLKSSYGGISNYRFHEANKQTGISEKDWESAKLALIDRKMLNKRGAITVDGRNAVGNKQTFQMS